MKISQKLTEAVFSIIFFLCGAVSVVFVIATALFLTVKGLPALARIGVSDFLLGTSWKPLANEADFGILPFILTSLYLTAFAVALGAPIGFFCSVYISKKAGNVTKKAARQAVEMLAGIPSVVFGLVGMAVLVPAVRKMFSLSDGACFLSAALILAVMILPTVIKVALPALDAVPADFEAASLALGATPEETWFRVSVPSAKSGIAAAVTLGAGRAVGEAMAVMMISGNAPNMPSLFASVRPLTSAVASEVSYASGLHRQALFSCALVLFLLIMIINALLDFFLRTNKNK